MEEKKFDLNSIIGFVLIFIILIGMLYLNKPSEEEIKAAEKAKQEQVDADAKKEANKPEVTTTPEEDYNVSDSLGMEKAKAQLGAFAFSAKYANDTNKFTVLENEVLSLKISKKGGYIHEALLKQFKTYDSVNHWIKLL